MRDLTPVDRGGQGVGGSGHVALVCDDYGVERGPEWVAGFGVDLQSPRRVIASEPTEPAVEIDGSAEEEAGAGNAGALRPDDDGDALMKQAGDVLIRLDRDSVAAGDDVEPHEEDREVDARRPLDRFIVELVRDHYLPQIQGGQSCWIVRTQRRGQALGVASVRYGDFDGVRFVEGRQLDVGHVGDSLFFEYAAQESPDAVFARL